MKKFYLLVLVSIALNNVFSANAQSTIVAGGDQALTTLPVNLAVLGGNSLSMADASFEDAERYERFGDFDNAIAMFNKAASEYQQTKKFNRYGATLIRLSSVYMMLSNYSEAERIVLKQVLRNYSRIGSKAGQMSAYQQLGKIYLAANKLPQSLWFYTQHGILAQQLHDNNAYIESILGIASVKIKKKDYLLAVRDLNTAELLSKDAKTVQYNHQIKSNRALIAERTTVIKKG